MNRKLTPAALLAVALAATACSITTPEPDQVGIVYDAGPLSDTSFQNCINPGKQDISGPNDQAYLYPAGQRTFEFAADPADPAGLKPKKNAEAGPIGTVTKDPLDLSVSGVATFSLATDCKTLQKFHEQIGLKYRAFEDAGWDKLLGVYIAQPLDRAMDAASKEFAWRDLVYANPQAKQDWEAKVAQYMSQFLTEQGGAGFFTNFSLSLMPQPPAGVRKAMAEAQQAVEENKAQVAKNATAKTAMEPLRELVEILGAEGAVLYKAIQDGRIQVIVSDGQVNVTPGKAQ
ncbi:SPFH domain-containing protein [Nonomuraea sp. NPDC050328]|uniref:SPFH domain-containing protein n=1 Tax=Nonomuraea sp. NPDC050328 TaxID=3364361 RepID=UPI0037B90DA2